MSIFEKWSAGMVNKDVNALNALLHEDYTFVRHQTGSTMNKSQMTEILRGFMSNETINVHNHRCLYENEDVMVEHSVIDFPDGTKEAVLTFYTLQDGLLFRAETGATLIKE